MQHLKVFGDAAKTVMSAMYEERISDSEWKVNELKNSYIAKVENAKPKVGVSSNDLDPDTYQELIETITELCSKTIASLKHEKVAFLYRYNTYADLAAIDDEANRKCTKWQHEKCEEVMLVFLKVLAKLNRQIVTALHSHPTPIPHHSHLESSSESADAQPHGHGHHVTMDT